MAKKKSVISLISYDANRFLAKSIKRYYNYVDEIVLGIDKDRMTWSGNDFSIDEDSLWSELSQIDGEGKISIIEEDFHQSKIWASIPSFLVQNEKNIEDEICNLQMWKNSQEKNYHRFKVIKSKNYNIFGY